MEPTRDETDLRGTTVGHYAVIERLGAGGMGIVYKARDTRLNRMVALKVLPPSLSRDGVARDRFIEEARTASAFDHPHVCTVHDIGETMDGTVFIAMAYVPGESLKVRLTRGALPLREALDVAIQITEGLIEAHEHGIVHRDVKPGNVLLTPDGTVKIVDFGLATLVGLVLEHQPLVIMGTLPYMSPEQVRAEPVDHRSDIWSLGVTLVEMLTGRPLFGSGDDDPVLYRIQYEACPPLGELLPGAPPRLSAIVARCLAKDRAQRYRIAVDLLHDLVACRAELPGDVPPPAAVAAAPSLTGTVRRALSRLIRRRT